LHIIEASSITLRMYKLTLPRCNRESVLVVMLFVKHNNKWNHYEE